MRDLSLSIDDFESIRKPSNDYVYVDKTDLIYQLANKQRGLFFTRPRRFGKTLTCTTIKTLFEGKRELFEGLAIEKMGWEWKKHPVIFLPVNKIEVEAAEEIKAELCSMLGKEWLRHGMMPKANFACNLEKPGDLLEWLIKELQAKHGCDPVLIIDEYDNPIQQFLDAEPPTRARQKSPFQKACDAMAGFYKVLKIMNGSLRFSFVTGVARFPKTSIYSKMNHLDDLTLEATYATLCGYTKEELVDNFSEHIEAMAQKHKVSFDQQVETLTRWYNGYRFTDKDIRMFSPFSVMSALKKRTCLNFWLDTGNTRSVVETIRKHLAKGLPIKDLEGVEFPVGELNTLDGENINVQTLLLQTGYLTLDEILSENTWKLKLPNYEVGTTLRKHYASVLLDVNINNVHTNVYQMQDHLIANDIEMVGRSFQSLIGATPYTLLKEPNESNFHCAFFLIFRMLGFKIKAEYMTSTGIIDALLETATHRYIIEFKINSSAARALKQIRDKGYFHEFAAHTDKELILVGVAISGKTKKVKTTLETESTWAKLKKKRAAVKKSATSQKKKP